MGTASSMNPTSSDWTAEKIPTLGLCNDAEPAQGLAKKFLDHYALIEQPFGVTPDPRFLYLGLKHQEALTALAYGTETNRGFLTLIAKPGMGKTSLLFQYLEGQREKALTAFVFQTNGDSRDLMRYLLADLGLNGEGKDLPEMHSILNRLLVQEMRRGRRFIFVIDEAQNLDEKALESVRLLSNFETPWAKLMHIVLAGQPQLAERLAEPSMAQLCQRISFFIRIEPFTPEEVAAYIDHRLWIAGYKGSSLFSIGALRLIAERSEGIPRNINKICFAAMSLGWALKSKAIDHAMVSDVLADLSPGPLNRGTALLPKPKEEPKQPISPVLPTGKDSLPRDWPFKIQNTVLLEAGGKTKAIIQQAPRTRTLVNKLRSRGWLAKLAIAAPRLLAVGRLVNHGNRGAGRTSNRPASVPADIGFHAPTPVQATVDPAKSSPA